MAFQGRQPHEQTLVALGFLPAGSPGDPTFDFLPLRPTPPTPVAPQSTLHALYACLTAHLTLRDTDTLSALNFALLRTRNFPRAVGEREQVSVRLDVDHSVGHHGGSVNRRAKVGL